MTLWTLLTAIEEAKAICLALLNHTADPDLKRLIERAIKDIKEPTGRQVQELLTNEGVPMPPAAHAKAKANPDDVFPGAKLPDEEIAQLVLGKSEAVLVIIATGLVQVLREDVGAMLLRFQMQYLGEGYALKNVM